MKNEVDFLVFLGLSAGNILRYVRSSSRIDDSSLAQLLCLSPQELSKLENYTGQLPAKWHQSIRAYFHN